ncbi:MAG TPA: mevalonate kinase [Candidatus Acidoferrales bacterium]|nr:mevalonate kinase [Candidatus Acidoferrales bacterium]
MGRGLGFGKVILFNEHFVVYGIPAIVSAIGAKTTALVEQTPGSGYELKDERPETPGYKTEKFDQQKESLDIILKFMKIDTQHTHYTITLAGDLIAASGVGASAASCAAIARAFSDELNLNLSDQRVNEIAYEGEKGYHGTPSGIDNTAATYGGLIWYRRDGSKQLMERMRLRKPVEIVMGNTGKVADTKSVVAGVRERKEKEPEKYGRLLQDADHLVKNARKRLEDFNLEEVGACMDENHKLLQEIGVSSPELDALVKLARDNGAIGAKLTGTGKGGYMVALTPGRELQNRVADEIDKHGSQALRTLIGV